MTDDTRSRTVDRIAWVGSQRVHEMPAVERVGSWILGRARRISSLVREKVEALVVRDGARGIPTDGVPWSR